MEFMTKKSPLEISDRGKSGLDKAACCGKHRWEQSYASRNRKQTAFSKVRVKPRGKSSRRRVATYDGDGTRPRKTMYTGGSARTKESPALFRGVGREDKWQVKTETGLRFYLIHKGLAKRQPFICTYKTLSGANGLFWNGIPGRQKMHPGAFFFMFFVCRTK